ncbi:citrulline utilization hydrolase CtlX [Aquimarina sp. RZ0]|uniref:citrulline utilization hydrolase CtlX n=1 Tax=Aquimarina sp. RZ0 TaxID=2607730 RepID=UPI0011F2A635|nr:arginine deiminase-related protein [Aquimarina sp. RZ0]KAA1245753.1 amidinotransferase [Aquimarina sp. RZ0]
MKQITNTIVMIRPVHFRMNEQTAVNNYYQNTTDKSIEDVNSIAQQEFDAFVEMLTSAGVHIIVIDDDPKNDTPDSIFPNNWISFHEHGTVGLYPMFAVNRRKERRPEVLDIVEEAGFIIKDIIDYTAAENEEVFLEGTGSVVLDRVHRKAYCALSPRADEALFIEFCEDFEYTPVIFEAYQTVQGERMSIYHTNVMMGIGETFAIVCLASIDDKKERKNVVNHLKNDDKEVIAITENQVANFAGNMLQVIGADDTRYLVMSSAAFNSLSADQIARIEKHNEILHSDLSMIEKLGGGSARCMMAEIFLPSK